MKYSTICLMVPTYKRIAKLKGFIDSAIRTVDKVERIKFCFCVNRKDLDTQAFVTQFGNESNVEMILEDTRQPNLALYFNKMYSETKFTDAIVSELGDDMLFLSKGWDTRVLDTINGSDGNGIVYFNDDYVAKEKCCVNMFVSRDLVNLTRKPFMCEFFHADMIDMVWTLVGAMTGLLRYQDDMVIQHNHSTKDPSEKWDDTFKRLSPVQKAANAPSNQRLAIAYATLCAKNIIDSGVGAWNVLC